VAQSNPAVSAPPLTPTTPSSPPAHHIFKLSLDVDLRFVVTAIQCERGTIALAQKLCRAQLLVWVQKQIAAGHTVHTVYEACGFGYTLHHALSVAGAHSIVTTPMRLSRHLDGHAHELQPIRIPSAQEQERRELGRQRNFLARQVRRLENHGRALRLEFEHQTLPGGWAGPLKWKELSAQCSAFVRGQLEPMVGQIRQVKEQIVQLTVQIQATVAREKIPVGLGALTVALLEGEVCDWQRFQGRKAVGSYTGCCPSEHSSGGVQRFGHIDRHGNKHVRTLLVEAVWRLLRWQPEWHARKKFLLKMKVGASLKKKMAVALARQLAIDLWRWRTGRCTAADLGWEVRSAAGAAASAEATTTI
jgi:transposase